MKDISRYVEQLVEIIAQNHCKVVSNSIFTENNRQRFFETVKQSKSISSLVGIEKQELPQICKLNKSQSEKLINSITNFLASLRIYFDFPNRLSVSSKYEHVYNCWNNTMSLTDKEHHIEFCHYNNENCPYEDCCTICSELKDED